MSLYPRQGGDYLLVSHKATQLDIIFSLNFTLLEIIGSILSQILSTRGNSFVAALKFAELQSLIGDLHDYIRYSATPTYGISEPPAPQKMFWDS